MRIARSFSFASVLALAAVGCAVDPAGDAPSAGPAPGSDVSSVLVERPAGDVDLSRVTLRYEYVADDGSIADKDVAARAVLEDGRIRVLAAEPLTPGARYRAVFGEAGETQVVDVRMPETPQATPTTAVPVSPLAANVSIPLSPSLSLEGLWTNTDAFYVKKISPAAEGKLERNGAGWTRTITAYFGGTSKIDCSRLPMVKAGVDGATDSHVFRVSTRRDSSTATQLMYAKASASSPGDTGYRGHFSCDDKANTLTFHLPGRPLGAARVVVHVFATAKDGKLARQELELRTTNPDVLVEMTKFIKNDHTNCEGWLDKDKGFRRCDIYFATASLKRDKSIDKGDVQASRHPESGNWGNTSHDTLESISAQNYRVYEGPVGDGVDIEVRALDSDGGGSLGSAAAILGKVSSAICSGFQAYCGKDAAKYGDEAHQLIAKVLTEHGEDDLMSKATVRLRDGGGTPSYWKNWGLDGHAADGESYGDPIQLGGEQQVKVYMRVREAAPSWK